MMGLPIAKTAIVEVLNAEWEVPEDVANAHEVMKSALNYIADNTYCGHDAEWHFKPGYDPQIVLEALSWFSSVEGAQVNNVEQSQVNRVGCRECGDEYWDRSIGGNCPNCGESLMEISPKGDSE